MLAVVGMASMIDTVDGFQRVPVPGQAKVSFADPGGYTLYFEGPGISDGISDVSETGTVHIELEPTSPGPYPSLNDYHGSVTYNLAGHEGMAVGTIQIAQPGTYLLSTGEPTRPGVTNVAVGRGIARGSVRSVVLLVTAILILIPAGLVIGSLTFVRRHRARRGQPTSWQGVPPTVAAAAALAGWYPDPAERHERRLWDGLRWTEQVSDHGAQGVDPLGEPTSTTATSAGTPLDSSRPPQDAKHPQE